METLDGSDGERRQKKKKVAGIKSLAVFLLKTLFALAPLLTRVVQLVILILELFK